LTLSKFLEIEIFGIHFSERKRVVDASLSKEAASLCLDGGCFGIAKLE